MRAIVEAGVPEVSIHALVRVRLFRRGIYVNILLVSIHALVRVRLLDVYGLIINSATGVLRQPPMGGTKIPGREKEMIVVKIRTPTDYENRRCPGNFL